MVVRRHRIADCVIARCVRVGALVAALAVAACGGGAAPEVSGANFQAPETAVDYVVRIDGMPDEEMAELAAEALSVFRQQDAGAYSVALLRRRAENDLETVGQILRSRGYYNGSAEVVVDEISREEYDELDEFDPKLPSFSDLLFWRNGDEEERAPESFALVVITVDPGAQFTLERHEFDILDPAMEAVVPAPRALGSPVGGPAVAVPIVGAEAAAVKLLKDGGYPYAESVGRDAVADLALAALEVESQLRSGPPAVFGQVSFEGIEDVRESYLRTYIPWEPGEVVDQDLLREFQEALLATNLFDSLLVQIPPDPPARVPVDAPVTLPVAVTADERPFRTVAAGGGYSTDEGPFLTGRFEHRNIWSENETVSAEATVGVELQQFLLGYREPQYLAPGQDLLAGLELVREEDDAFDQLRATLTAGLRRRLTPEWVVGYGGLLEASRIKEDDEAEEREAYLAGIPVFAEFDDTDDLLNPTKGGRARFRVTPIAGSYDEEFTAFLELDTGASAYWDILDDDTYVLAGRTRVASIIAEDFDRVPANRRLYSGGGGSVRGYARRFVGPLDDDDDPIGGLSALEASVELRARIWEDIGGVLFVDAGSVSRESYPDFEEGVQVAVGTGVRYYSPAGPIRLDIAFPVNGRDADDFFQFYFSIGQAF